MAETSSKASIVKGYKVFYAPYAETQPELSGTGTWVEITNTFSKIPNFFPKGDSIDVTTVDSVIQENIEGLPGAEEYVFDAYWTKGLAEAHTAMVADQTDPEKGFFWFRVDYTNRGETVVGKFTTTENLPTPEGNAGDVDSIEFTLYSQGHSKTATPAA